MLKKSQSPHFTVFGIVRFLKMNNFCFEIRFSQTQHVIFFLCDFFSDFFSSKPPQFLPETKRFASIKDCSRFSPLCDLPETLILKLFRKKYFLNFLFFERFLIEKVVFFCCFHLEKYGFRDLCVSLRVFFGAVNLIKFQQCHFTLGSLYDVADVVFLKVRNFLRKCLRSTASPLLHY